VRISGNRPTPSTNTATQGRKRHRACRNRLLFVLSAVVIFEAVPATHRRAGACRRSQPPAAFVVNRCLDCGRFFRARNAQADRQGDFERSAGSGCPPLWLRHVVVDRGTDRTRRVALGYAWADAAAAIVVAVFICVAGYRLGRRTIDTLTDTAPAGVSEPCSGDRAPGYRASSPSSGCGRGPPARSCS